MTRSRARYVNLVRTLRLARAIAGYPQWRVAREIGAGVNRSRLADWEAMTRQPRAEYLIRWAGAVGLELIPTPTAERR